jgi:psiF repeat
MKNSIAILALMLSGSIGAMAQAPAPAPQTSQATPNSQQQRMKDCSQKATGKKGDDRKAFMSSCLSGADTSASSKKLTSSQERMKKCNADAAAKSLKGDDRKKFMSTCLKAS